MPASSGVRTAVMPGRALESAGMLFICFARFSGPKEVKWKKLRQRKSSENKPKNASGGWVQTGESVFFCG